MNIGVLAHQGGWDEVLLVALPLFLFAGLIWNAKRRAQRGQQESPPQQESREQPDVDLIAHKQRNDRHEDQQEPRELPPTPTWAVEVTPLDD